MEALTPREIIRLLGAQYGELPRRPRRDPLDELVLGVLSQNTSDVNSGRAFARLQDAFVDWQAVLAADRQDIKEAIRQAGWRRRRRHASRRCWRRSWSGAVHSTCHFSPTCR